MLASWRYTNRHVENAWAYRCVGQGYFTTCESVVAARKAAGTWSTELGVPVTSQRDVKGKMGAMSKGNVGLCCYAPVHLFAP